MFSKYDIFTEEEIDIKLPADFLKVTTKTADL